MEKKITINYSITNFVLYLVTSLILLALLNLIFNLVFYINDLQFVLTSTLHFVTSFFILYLIYITLVYFIMYYIFTIKRNLTSEVLKKQFYYVLTVTLVLLAVVLVYDIIVNASTYKGGFYLMLLVPHFILPFLTSFYFNMKNVIQQ